jgi:hypothetical protein
LIDAFAIGYGFCSPFIQKSQSIWKKKPNVIL